MEVLPLAFLAARNVSQLMSLCLFLRRILDFVRGLDALIWTTVLARGFGPDPMTGALTTLMTDINSFGKFLSKVLENVDEKQIEGVFSAGVGPRQGYRFSVLLRGCPALLSQVLCFFESNA